MTDLTPDRLRSKSEYSKLVPDSHRLPDGKVAPFPRKRFEQFLSVLQVQSKDAGLVPFHLLGSQIYLLDEIERGIAEGITTYVVLKARGGGISTVLLALDIFWACEYPGTLGAFITQEEAAREQFRSQVEVFQMTIPKKYKVQTPTNNRLLLIFENTSLFRYLVAGTRTTTNKLGRSGHSNYIHATECAFWGSPEDVKALKQSLSELHPHRLYIYESTPNGFNHYEEMWRTAKDSPAQKAVFIGWWRDERNEFGEDHPLYKQYMPRGRDTPLSGLERKRVRRVAELYDFPITAGQIAWYRYHLENKCEGDQATMDQEMPWTEEEAFVATGAEFFSNEALTDQNREAQQHKCYPFVFKLTNRWEEIALYKAAIDRCDLKIWEMPEKEGVYSLGCDPSFGTGRDDGAISVRRGYADCSIQVAEYAANGHSPHQQAWVLAFLCGLYRNTMPIIELQTCGRSVLGELERVRELSSTLPHEANPVLQNCLAHMRHFLYRRIDSLGGSLVRHWSSTHDLKDALLSDYKGWIETGVSQVRSLYLLEQMRRTVDDDGELGAAGSFKDDRVMADALACHAWDRWLRPQLKTQGMTFEHAQELARRGGHEDPVESLVRNYLMRTKITLRRDQVPL